MRYFLDRKITFLDDEEGFALRLLGLRTAV